MTAPPARRAIIQKPAKIIGPAAADLIAMFVDLNPAASREEVTQIGKLVADFSAVASNLSPEARKRLTTRKAQFRRFITELVVEPDAAPEPLILAAKSAAEVSQGARLDQPLAAQEGRARIAAYATPTKVEDWAGCLAGPTELERHYGIARSTLHAWQQQGAVIGLLVGVRKHAFPTEQFVDGRPVAGLGAVVEAIGDPRTAWLWLREPNPGLDGAAPLTRLMAGAVGAVVDVARANFAKG